MAERRQWWVIRMKLPLSTPVKALPPRLLHSDGQTATFALPPAIGTSEEVSKLLAEDEELLSSGGINGFSLEAQPTRKLLKGGGLFNLLRRPV